MRTPYAARRPVANSYLVRERDRRRLHELAAVLLAVGCLGGGLLAYTWVHAEQLSTGYRIEELERRSDELGRLERQLLLEASYLASPQRIERRASQELGMRPLAVDQVLFWEELR